MYSGFGIGYNENTNIYIIIYFNYLFCFLLSFTIFSKIKITCFEDKLSPIRNKKLLFLIVIIYWVIKIVYLLYPQNILIRIFNPVLSLIDIFGRQNEKVNNSILYFLNLITLIVKPFYFVFLLKYLKKNVFILLFVFDIYISFITNAYISKSEIFTNILFIIMSIIYFNKQNYYIRNIKTKNSSLKIVVIFIILLIVVLPYISDFNEIRVGNEIESITKIQKVYNMIEKEVDYPKRYSTMDTEDFRLKRNEYLKWLVTLPIPKRVINVKTITINYYFTEKLTGKVPDSLGYTVFLPSVLGEAILLYGKYLSFKHAIILGFIIGILMSFINKNRVFMLWGLFLITQIIIIPRGGTQGALSLIINSSILIIIYSSTAKIRNTLK